jgi:hypothetical protein
MKISLESMKVETLAIQRKRCNNLVIIQGVSVKELQK